METANYNPQDFQPGGRHEADKNLLVKFFVKPRQDKGASKEEGRPIFKDTEYIDIKIPGNRSGGACRPATGGDRQRFPEHYAAFKQRTENDETIVGTPLTEWPLISRSMAEELAFFHVQTVEQLANMADVQVGKFMGLFQIKEKANLWIDSAAKEKPMWEMDQKIKQMRAENDELRDEMRSLIQRLEGVPIDGEEEMTPAQKKRSKKRAAAKAKAAIED